MSQPLKRRRQFSTQSRSSNSSIANNNEDSVDKNITIASLRQYVKKLARQSRSKKRAIDDIAAADAVDSKAVVSVSNGNNDVSREVAPQSEAGEKKPIQVLIKQLTGETMVITIDPDDAVLRLMQIYEERAGLPVSLQRLTFGKHTLEEGRTLRHYNITQCVTIQLVGRLRGC
jgi:hypothetical protein